LVANVKFYVAVRGLDRFLMLPPAVLSRCHSGQRYLSIVELRDTQERRPAEEIVIYLGLIGVGLLLAVVGVPLAARSAWPLLALLAVPLAREPVDAVRGGGVGRALIPALGGVGRLELAVAVLLAAGLLLS